MPSELPYRLRTSRAARPANNKYDAKVVNHGREAAWPKPPLDNNQI